MNAAALRAWQLFARDAEWALLGSVDLERFTEFVRSSVQAGDPRPDFRALASAEVPEGVPTAEVAERLDALYDLAERFFRERLSQGPSEAPG